MIHESNSWKQQMADPYGVAINRIRGSFFQGGDTVIVVKKCNCAPLAQMVTFDIWK